MTVQSTSSVPSSTQIAQLADQISAQIDSSKTPQQKAQDSLLDFQAKWALTWTPPLLTDPGVCTTWADRSGPACRADMDALINQFRAASTDTGASGDSVAAATLGASVGIADVGAGDTAASAAYKKIEQSVNGAAATVAAAAASASTQISAAAGMVESNARRIDDAVGTAAPAATETDSGADAVAAANAAAASVAINTAGMSVSQMVMLVFGAANQARENLAKDQLDDLNQKNQDVAKLTSLMSSVRAAIPSDTTKDGTLPAQTTAALQSYGIPIPATDGDATKMVGSNMSTLVENIKSAIDTLNSTQTLQLQSVTKINNDLSEGTQLIASTLSDAHQMDMGIIKS